MIFPSFDYFLVDKKKAPLYSRRAYQYFGNKLPISCTPSDKLSEKSSARDQLRETLNSLKNDEKETELEFKSARQSRDQAMKSLPEGVTYSVAYDRTALIDRAVRTLKEKLIEESIVVALVCLLFLMHLRS